MGIKLDWQIESEQTQARAGEDPEARRQRHVARRRLLLLIVGLAAVLIAAGAAIYWRLNQVDSQYRQDLLDTVEVETTALRIGDFAGFMAVQRSASDAFMLDQSRAFEAYQQLKQTHSVDLPGTVVDATIDHLRGRVVVQEIIDGVPYNVAWFYWFYEDKGSTDQGGWRHVPADLTFWGDEAEITSGAATVTYHTLDAALAAALAPRVGTWWSQGCQLLQCTALPPDLRVDIVAERPAALEWATYDAWTLRITSPLVDRARADAAIPPDLNTSIAQALARRLVRYAASDSVTPPPTDAAWIADELAGWLSWQFTGSAAASTGEFTRSLIAQYGAGAPGTLARTLPSQPTLDAALSAITGQSLAQIPGETLAALDWRGFFQWRLDVEAELLAQVDGSAALLDLYDLESASAASEVARRIEDPTYASRTAPQVQVVNVLRDDSGQTYAYVDAVRAEDGATTQIIWRLANGSWKRSN
ncbi:MAG TPA: hypothetical protein PKD09_13440 [Aggregatilinea sp.]|uniref:hypothetical protein n=1 Tax=Aggregatilinea sp. TaxID=2806333 RepID=UPI002CEA4F7B|nr:hypothetical protein [Aggregatilinea sp.]HML22650.1 hypothetical protein [Aggregatilinea sp.]